MAGVLLVLAAAAGAVTVSAMYSVAETYGDPAGGLLSTFGTFALIVLIGLLILVVLGVVAVAVVPTSGRRAVGFVVVGLVVATLGGVVAAGLVGLDAKRDQTAEPPGCGIGNPALAAEFRRIDHPGYFGGGSETRASCSYALTVADVGTALEAYDDELTRLGYDVVLTDRGLTATRDSFELTAWVRRPPNSDPYLQVSLR